MNKYLVYRWSCSRNCYWPLFSCATLDYAKGFVRHMRIVTWVSFIIVPNPHPRYDKNSK